MYVSASIHMNIAGWLADLWYIPDGFNLLISASLWFPFWQYARGLSRHPFRPIPGKSERIAMLSIQITRISGLGGLECGSRFYWRIVQVIWYVWIRWFDLLILIPAQTLRSHHLHSTSFDSPDWWNSKQATHIALTQSCSSSDWIFLFFSKSELVNRCVPIKEHQLPTVHAICLLSFFFNKGFGAINYVSILLKIF